MALNINGRMKVKTLRKDFKKEFGLALRVYVGVNFADEEATLASIRKGDSKGGEFSPQRNTKVGNLEDKIMDMFGIKTQVAGSDDSYLCDNDKTLAGALEADEKLMLKRVKRSDKADDIVNKDVTSNENSELEELNEEEKKWLKDIDNLEEAPQNIRESRKFMLEALEEECCVVEYASDILKNDKSFIIEAIKKQPYSFEFASKELQGDREVALLAIQGRSGSLEYASEELRNDKEIVLAAINEHGSALNYAADHFKNDKEIVLAALLTSHGLAFVHASEELKNDPEILLAAGKDSSSMEDNEMVDDDMFEDDDDFNWDD